MSEEIENTTTEEEVVDQDAAPDEDPFRTSNALYGVEDEYEPEDGE